MKTPSAHSKKTSRQTCALWLFLAFWPLAGCFNIQMSKKEVKEDSILSIKIQGLLTNEIAEEFMGYVRDYAGKDEIKGVLLRVDTPGGTVGASQEINATIKEVREFYKKPVVVSGGDIVASGGVYAIMSANQIFLNPGTLFGSIGVLMQFQNVSELIRWAKMDIYHLKAGEFKDSGNPFRQMTLRERELFENLLETALDQFKDAIAKGRSLEAKAVDRIADGRIIPGAEAVDLGLADVLGPFNAAVREIGKMTGLGSDPKLFSPTDEPPFFQHLDSLLKPPSFEKIFLKFLPLRSFSGQPLFLLPSYLSAK